MPVMSMSVLNHQSTDGSSQNSCMDYFSNTGANAASTASTKPNQHDFDELNTIYANLDTTSTGQRKQQRGVAAAITDLTTN